MGSLAAPRGEELGQKSQRLHQERHRTGALVVLGLAPAIHWICAWVENCPVLHGYFYFQVNNYPSFHFLCLSQLVPLSSLQSPILFACF